MLAQAAAFGRDALQKAGLEQRAHHGAADGRHQGVAVVRAALLSVVEDWMSVPGGYVEHLHRGFESVTLVFEGAVRCAHASGETELLTAGDVQWVTAGRGVMHAELPEGDGEAHLIQLWLNLPAAQKRSEEHTSELQSLAYLLFPLLL